MASRALDLLCQIARRFPSVIEPEMTFAYGSGVFQQANHAPTSSNMIDMCIVVDKANLIPWHRENMALNPADYSALRRLGPEKISALQESSFGAQVYFNTLVRTSDSHLIKYGVISTEALINDLLDWSSLYVAGRLHKPVAHMKDAKNDDLKSAIKVNLENAVHTALLLLPEQFNQFQLYSTLTALSYTGDIRMGIAENDNKVANIVTANLDRFQDLYDSSLEQAHIAQYVTHCSTTKTYSQDVSSNTFYHHLNYLPHNLISHIVNEYNKDGSHRDREEVMHILKEDFRLDHKVIQGLRQIILNSSWKQTSKGILTAGLRKSIFYAGQKVAKKWKSTRKKDGAFDSKELTN